MRFARTVDYGSTWIGTGPVIDPQPAGSILVDDSFSPEINVADDGTIYIVWITGSEDEPGSEIKMIVSNDGGDSFHAVASPADGIKSLSLGLPSPHGWPVFPGGSFRVLTLPTACVSGETVAVAWADFRDGVSRIYYALSTNGGTSWTTGTKGQPLLGAAALDPQQQHFHPQIVADPDGAFGCAFYEFGPKPTTPRIDVNIAFSVDNGTTFSKYETVTDQPWDPAVDAPWSHGDSNVTFIGDYFGFDASDKGFYPLWTDTRTGIQELWTAIVPKYTFALPSNVLGQVAQILYGIIQDGGGAEIVGGHIIHIPPWGPPELDILLSIAAHRIAAQVTNAAGVHLQRAALELVVSVARQELRRIGAQTAGR
jgi:hypothetical protein